MPDRAATKSGVVTTPRDENLPRAPTVVLLVDKLALPRFALERAADTARALAAEVHVVIALQPDRMREVDAIAALECIADRLIDVGIDIRDIEIYAGKMRRVIAELKSNEPIALIVMSSNGDGALGVGIADELKAPVLVAREPRPGGSIVATTNMKRPNYPVLAASQKLAHVLHKSITFFHNARPTFPVTLNPMAAPIPYITASGQDDGALEKLARLRTLAHDDAETVVGRSRATVDSILEIARQRRADIVTVGHSTQSWLGRVFGHDLAEELIDRCPQSVLVVPVPSQ